MATLILWAPWLLAAVFFVLWRSERCDRMYYQWNERRYCRLLYREWARQRRAMVARQQKETTP